MTTGIKAENGIFIKEMFKLDRLKNVNINDFEFDGKRTSPPVFLTIPYTGNIPKDEDLEDRVEELFLYRNQYCLLKKYTHLHRTWCLF